MYPNINNTGQGDDKNNVKESQEVSLGGEGGEEEADEGDAGKVGGSQGEQAKDHLHCSSHSWSYFVRSFFRVFAQCDQLRI